MPNSTSATCERACEAPYLPLPRKPIEHIGLQLTSKFSMAIIVRREALVHGIRLNDYADSTAVCTLAQWQASLAESPPLRPGRLAACGAARSG